MDLEFGIFVPPEYQCEIFLLCFGTIKIQPELQYLKTIIEVSTSSFQRAKTWEDEFGRVTSISFIFTGSKMDRICKMMMIAFITIKSSLVPLIEGLCA